MDNGDADAFVAYHEAGHVVAAWCLKIRVRRVTIVSDGVLGGLVTNERDKPSTLAAIGTGDRWHSSRLRAERLVMYSQAGEVAQLRFDLHSVSLHHSQLDLENSLTILARYAIHDVKPDMRLHYDLLYKWTESLIEQQWHLVGAVAKALLEHRKLSGTQVRAVIEAANQEQTVINVTSLLDVAEAIRQRRPGQARAAIKKRRNVAGDTP